MTGSLAVEMHNATAADADGIVGRDHLEALRALRLGHGPSPRSGVGNSQMPQVPTPPASPRKPDGRRHRGYAHSVPNASAIMTDTDARLWHPWLRINRVLRVILHTRWFAEARAPGCLSDLFRHPRTSSGSCHLGWIGFCESWRLDHLKRMRGCCAFVASG